VLFCPFPASCSCFPFVPVPVSCYSLVVTLWQEPNQGKCYLRLFSSHVVLLIPVRASHAPRPASRGECAACSPLVLYNLRL
jgi:hypothetical protein